MYQLFQCLRICLCATVDLSEDVKAAGSKIDRVDSRLRICLLPQSYVYKYVDTSYHIISVRYEQRCEKYGREIERYEW